MQGVLFPPLPDDELGGSAGQIKRIVLQDFMCHSHLEINFT
jgi:hypothetical protein